MIIDLHTHTTKYSMCSIISPDDLASAYIKKGVDAICITEHNRLWNEKEQSELVKKYQSKIKIFFGMEVDTEIGHILVFGGKFTKNDGTISIKKLLKEIDRKSTALIWAHPFRWEKIFPTKTLLNKEFLSNFDAVELYNGNLSPQIQENTKEKLADFDIKLTGASDTHSEKMACK